MIIFTRALQFFYWIYASEGYFDGFMNEVRESGLSSYCAPVELGLQARLIHMTITRGYCVYFTKEFGGTLRRRILRCFSSVT